MLSICSRISGCLPFLTRTAFATALLAWITGHTVLAFQGDPAGKRAGVEDLRITEIMYHPLDVDVLDGDSLEYIELKNVSGSVVDLSGIAFTDGISYAFENSVTLAPEAFVVLASNAIEFTNHYGFAPFGDYDGRLDNGGEQITLSDGLNDITFVYSDRHPWPVGPDGAGFSLVLAEDSPGLDLSDPGNWKGSRFAGSPGVDEQLVERPASVQINEVLTHTDLPFKDAVELFNPGAASVDISGWYITDVKEEPRKFQIPAGTSIAAGGYLVFDEDDFNPAPGVPPSFALSSFGDGIYLFSADTQDNLTGYVRGFTFGGADNGVTFGREEWVSGEEELLPQLSETLGRENSGPRIGPVVISELMYGPPDGQDEFVELVNISSQTISLFDQQFPENTWQFEGVDFSFPQNTTMGPGAIVLVISGDPAGFRAARNVPADVAIFGPYTGKLNNAGEAIQLQAPDDPDVGGQVPYFNMDEVIYGDANPWPISADGGGASLEKIKLDGLGSDPANWLDRDGGTPGFVDLGSVSTEDSNPLSFSLKVSPAYPNPFNDATVVSFSSEMTAHVRVKLYDVLGRVIRVVFDEMVPGGAKNKVKIERSSLPAGIYFVKVEGAGMQDHAQAVIAR